VGPTGGHRWTFEAHRFGLRLAPGPGRPAFTLRVEEERTGHAAARGVQLPVPQIGIRAGKAPGIRHFDPLGDDLNPNSPTGLGIWARSAARIDESGVIVIEMTADAFSRLPCSGRIRADPGAVDLQTLERFSSRDKTLITFFVDLEKDCPGGGRRTGAEEVCVVAHTTVLAKIGGARLQHECGRLLSALRDQSTCWLCPKNPLLGPYCRSTGVNVFGSSPAGFLAGSLLFGSSVASTPFAGGVT
jgi:hypothetical protein